MPTTPPNDPATHDHDTPVTREREVIVTNNGGNNGSNIGSTLLAIVGILVILLVGYFAIQAFNGSDGGMEIPTEFDVNINDGGAPAPEGG